MEVSNLMPLTSIGLLQKLWVMGLIDASSFEDFTMRTVGMGSIGFALIFLSAPAHAGEVKVGNVAVQLSPPSGYCELDRSIEHDKILSTNTSNLAEGAGNSYFALFTNCQELTSARKTKEFIPTKIIVHGAGLSASDQKDLQRVCDGLKTFKVSDQQKDMQDNVKKNSGGTRLGDQEGLGVLDEVKNEVCYYGLVQNVDVDGKNLRLLTILAVTLRQHTTFFIYDSRPLDSTSIAAGLAHAKSVYADFVKANPN
jgi:hypothetical protein